MCAGLPDYYRYNIPKRGKHSLQNIQDVHKICIPKFSTPRPSKIHKISNFWYENITSGNPERVAIKLFAVPLAISINNNL
jgi:hypothetical protein